MNDDIIQLAFKVRRDIISMAFKAGVNGGHIGGALSCADILAVLYGEVLNLSTEHLNYDRRDRFILSKGHVALAHYAVLAETGFFDKEKLFRFEQSGGDLQTHENMNITCGIEISGGSLGWGLSIGVGCALNAKIRKKDYKTYVLLGDGECNEGTIWESAMSASKFQLDNLIAIVDCNKQSLDGFISTVMPISNIEQVFDGFGWNVKIVNGHDLDELTIALKSIDGNRPTVVIANTIKGKGVKSIEGKEGWHHAQLTEELYQQFCEELGVPK